MTGRWSLPVSWPVCRSWTMMPRSNTWSSGRNGDRSRTSRRRSVSIGGKADEVARLAAEAGVGLEILERIGPGRRVEIADDEQRALDGLGDALDGGELLGAAARSEGPVHMRGHHRKMRAVGEREDGDDVRRCAASPEAFDGQSSGVMSLSNGNFEKSAEVGPLAAVAMHRIGVVGREQAARAPWPARGKYSCSATMSGFSSAMACATRSMS